VSVYKRLEALNIALPKLTPPAAAFVPFLRSRRPGSYQWLVSDDRHDLCSGGSGTTACERRQGGAWPRYRTNDGAPRVASQRPVLCLDDATDSDIRAHGHRHRCGCRGSRCATVRPCRRRFAGAGRFVWSAISIRSAKFARGGGWGLRRACEAVRVTPRVEPRRTPCFRILARAGRR
jgi:hypothetical protein